MRYYIMTLISIVAVVAIKSYTINAQGRAINDIDVELMAATDLLNHADTVRHEKMIERFVQGIEKSEYVYGKYAGSAEFPTQTYVNYERILRVGTTQELHALLLHESPVVRVYAHKALTANDMAIETALLEVLIADTTQVVCIDGLAISKMRVMDIVSENIFQ